MIEIAFFEDNRAFYMRLENLFREHNITAKGWSDYNQLECRLTETNPKIVLLDIVIEDNHRAGLDALEWIRSHPSFKKIKVLVLTSQIKHLEEALRLKASGFLCKEDLQDNIEFLKDLMKINPVSPSAIKKMIQNYQPPSNDYELAERQMEIICLAAGDRSTIDIVAALKESKQELSRHTVETHLKIIRWKLDCHTIQGAVAKAILYRLIDWNKIQFLEKIT